MILTLFFFFPSFKSHKFWVWNDAVDHFIVWQRIDERDAERVSDPAAKFILQDDLFSWNVQLPQLTYGSSVYYTVQGMDDAHNIGIHSLISDFETILII